MKTKLTFVFLFVTTIILAQNNLFSNISTTDRYQRFFSVQDEDGDGIHEIKDRDLIVKFNIETLATGEGYKVEAVIDAGNSKGNTLKKMDAVNGYATSAGFPYESFIRHRPTKQAFVAIGDYVFLLYKMSESGVSYGGISSVFIKIDPSQSNVASNGKKKKSSFKEKMRAFKNARSSKPSYGEAHKALQSQNLDKLITDYLVAMKAKQDTRTTTEKRKDNNIITAKNRGDKDIKRYNDSVKATPEYKDLQSRIKLNEKNGREARMRNDVTLKNNSSSTIYVAKSGSSNKGTEIRPGGTAQWSCSQDAYIQLTSKRGSTYSYSNTSTKVYSENTGCGNTVNIN